MNCPMGILFYAPQRSPGVISTSVPSTACYVRILRPTDPYHIHDDTDKT